MEKLIEEIVKILNDYRKDEDNPDVRVTGESVALWIGQFDDEVQIPILTEFVNILKFRYCSKADVRRFLKNVIGTLAKDLKSSEADLLKNSSFLDLQPARKSQSIMLELLDELISSEYGVSLDECGSVSHKYSIYIDDVLCTGLKLVTNLEEWSAMEFSPGKTNQQAVEDGSTKLILAYIFSHSKNYLKKISEMKRKISQSFATKLQMYRWVRIENAAEVGSKVDLIYPLEADQNETVAAYKDEIVERVNAYTSKNNYTSQDEFFRPANLPAKEEFFTSAENRKIVEDTFLLKGIEILSKANVNNKNMRALGYSIPSSKNFGFGALCFTWRNVPNNAPLVFWYSGGGFTPLFKVSRGYNPLLNFTFEAIDD